jgi:hypothetical protein
MDNINLKGGDMPKINPFKYPSEKCSCGNEIFVPGVIFKKIPGMLVGQGTEDVQAPIKVFFCSKCGELSPYDKELFAEANEEKPKTDLII